MQELLLHRRVMAVGGDIDHVPAVVAEMLDRFLTCHIPLVGKEREKYEEQDANYGDEDDAGEYASSLFLEGNLAEK